MERLDTPAGSSSLSAAVGDATSVLLTGPTRNVRVTDAALSLLAVPRPAATDVSWVTMTRSPADVARRWVDFGADAPARLQVVEVGTRRTRPDEDRSVEGLDYETAHVESPSNLTSLGVRLTETTDQAATADRRQSRLWFESLSTLLQYVPATDAFKFVHTLHSRLAGREATIYYHLDPAIHDTRTIHTLLSICDARITVEDDGLVVQRR